ncbi:SRPBCC family protein [Pectobacterium aroidearum]|uniref:SRPBCC family protein n=1 Tax=Pectobacterium aroidearum TaxID=1201031 RepID=UPI0032EC5155
MANAYTSWIIDAPVERVWALVRDFNALPDWNPGISESVIEQGLASDTVGAIRSLKLADGAPGRERLLALDDRHYNVTYNFELAPLPLDNYIGRIDLKPLSDGGTLAIWHSTYDERPENSAPFKDVLERDVFAAGFRSLAETLANESDGGQDAGLRQPLPGKVYVTGRVSAPLADVWPVLRASAGLGPWYAAPQAPSAIAPRSGQVGEQRKLALHGHLATETLTGLSDHHRHLHYSVRHDQAAWQDYDATVELLPVTMDGTTLVVWTLDWPNADASPDVDQHHSALKRALQTLSDEVAGGRR